jgi:RNA binding exosome subunit
MCVNRRFVDLHARILCHATEDLEKVELAMTNALGPVELNLRSTEGHHGNPLTIIEAVIDVEREISEFFQRLREEDIEAIAGSLATRVDNGCNLFIRLDKQLAFLGDLRLATNDDVVSIRIRVSAYPAKADLAVSIVEGFLKELLDARRASLR